MYTNAFGRNIFADMLDILMDLVHMIFRTKPSGYTNAYGESIVADIADMGTTFVHLLFHNIVLFLAIAVIGFAWQPLILPAAQNPGNLLNPAPQVVVNPPAVIVPSQTLTPSATPTPTETPTLTPTPTPAATLTMTSVPAMTWQDAEAYIQKNCMWMSLEEALNAPPEWKTWDFFPQGKAILAVFPDASLGAFNGGTPERCACVFSPLGGAYAFVNEKGEVEVVRTLRP